MELKKKGLSVYTRSPFCMFGLWGGKIQGADNHLPWIWAALRRANKVGKERTTGLRALARGLYLGCEDELSFI